MQAARDQFDISERQACRYLRVNSRMVRYVRIAKNDAELRARLEEPECVNGFDTMRLYLSSIC